MGNWQTNSVTLGTYRVEVFASPVGDASGHGEGKTFLGAVSLSVTSSTNPFAFVLADPAATGQVISVSGGYSMV